jgi:hypothetical protein
MSASARLRAGQQGGRLLLGGARFRVQLPLLATPAAPPDRSPSPRLAG